MKICGFMVLEWGITSVLYREAVLYSEVKQHIKVLEWDITSVLYREAVLYSEVKDSPGSLHHR